MELTRGQVVGLFGIMMQQSMDADVELQEIHDGMHVIATSRFGQSHFKLKSDGSWTAMAKPAAEPAQ